MKRNELKTWAARFVTIGLMTLITSCGSSNPPTPVPGGPGLINNGLVGCVPIPMNGMTTMPTTVPGQTPIGGIPFQATGFSLNSVNLAFGRLPTGQSIGQVQMGGVSTLGVGGMTYTGSSNATGSSIAVSLQSGMVGAVPGQYTTVPTTSGVNTAQRLVGYVSLSSYELQLAGLSQNYMMPTVGGQYPGQYQQYPNQYQYPQNGTTMVPGTGQTCVSGIGATGALNNAYMKFYGLMQDYVYVYINNGQSFIKFKI